uniref:anti-virulence regulator CigR family protein n=1 Tax=Halomonas sp. TaxID=1486246 RepID=UPI00261CD767|nr:anti-virulence regulator CigR family protein [Halomonas sp.]
MCRDNDMPLNNRVSGVWKPALLVLALATFSATAVAANNGHGNSQGHGPDKAQQQGHGGGQGNHGPDKLQDKGRGVDSSYRHDSNRSDSDFDRDHRDFDHGRDFDFDDNHIRNIFHDHRDWHAGNYQALPPGIRQNLQRGKPLPPGIAKQRFDNRFYDVLPRYDGYEWLQIGTAAVLINAANDVVEHIIWDIFD